MTAPLQLFQCFNVYENPPLDLEPVPKPRGEHFGPCLLENGYSVYRSRMTELPQFSGPDGVESIGLPQGISPYVLPAL